MSSEIENASLSQYQAFMEDLHSKVPFAYIRYGDGECKALLRRSSNWIKDPAWKNPEPKPGWKYVRGKRVYKRGRRLLRAAYYFRSPRYYVSAALPPFSDTLKEEGSHLDAYFLHRQIEQVYKNWGTELKSKKIVFVCNETADLTDLPFDVIKVFRIGADILRNFQSETVDEFLAEARQLPPGTIWFFCAGPLANIAIHKLWEQHPFHTYLDVGSLFDLAFGLGATRKYLRKKFSDTQLQEMIDVFKQASS